MGPTEQNRLPLAKGAGRQFHKQRQIAEQRPCFEYNRDVHVQVDAIYENGVLRPLQPLNLKEHERVVVSVVKAEGEPKGPRRAVEFIERLKTELGDAPIPSLEEVRERLSKIPESMADVIIAQRGER